MANCEPTLHIKVESLYVQKSTPKAKRGGFLVLGILHFAIPLTKTPQSPQQNPHNSTNTPCFPPSPAHVYDYGPVQFATEINDEQGTVSNGGGSGAACGHIGLVSGTLTANSESSTPLEFVSCLEDNSNLAKADSQVDGNWYSWYSATAGSEPKDQTTGNTQWSGGLAPDSICPKGWQLPTYSGDKSFYTLIITSYSMKNEGEARDSGTLSNPMSFVRSGLFGWYNAGLNYRGGNGVYWSLRSANTTSSNYLYFYNTYLGPQGSDNCGSGFAVRCVAE